MTKKSVFFLLLIGFLPFLFHSCLNLDVEKQYVADAYIASKIVGNDTLYAVESYVNSNTELKGVSMKFPDGSSKVDLSKFTTGYYEYAGVESSFKKQKPQTGNYAFTITYGDSSSVIAIDKLTDVIAKPVTIDSVKASEDGGSVEVAWKKNTDADLYTIKIFNKNEIVFSSGYLDSTYSAATIYSHSYGWLANSSPGSGDTLFMVISGVITDKSITDNTQFQSISQSAKYLFVWN